MKTGTDREFGSHFASHSPQGLALSFNGGKDCTALLHLQAAALHIYESKRLPSPSHPDGTGHIGSPIKTVYVTTVDHEDRFDEVESFVQQCKHNYGLDLVELPAPMKPALQTYLDNNPQIRAISVGTRRTDPYGSGLKPFLPTDNNYPSFVRVHAIVDWSYKDIWDFLRSLKVGWCKLYEMGYTSLGGKGTEKNSALSDGKGGYRPAWELEEEELERAGR